MDHIFSEDAAADQPAVNGDGSTLPCDQSAPSVPVATLISPPARPFDSMATAIDVTTTAPPPRPWGPWASVGWCVLGGVLEIIVTIIVLLVAGVAAAIGNPLGINQGDITRDFLSNGFLFSLRTLLLVPLGIAYYVWIIRWRGWRVRDYLAMNRVTGRQVLAWLALMGVYIGVFDSMIILAELDIGAAWMVTICQTAGSIPLLAIAVVVLIPFLEEVIFRGFLYRGIAASRLGPVGAILISTLFWSLLHVYYNLLGLLLIAVAGLLLGVARHRSGSLILPMLMHMTMNAVALVIVVVQLL